MKKNPTDISRNTSSGTTGDRVFYSSYHAQNKEINYKTKILQWLKNVYYKHAV